MLSSGFVGRRAARPSSAGELLELARATACVWWAQLPGRARHAASSGSTPPCSATCRLRGGLAVASQSGGMGFALLDLARDLGLGLHAFVSLGRQARRVEQRPPGRVDGRPRGRRCGAAISSRSATPSSSPGRPAVRRAQAAARRGRGPVAVARPRGRVRRGTSPVGRRGRRPARPVGGDRLPHRRRADGDRAPAHRAAAPGRAPRGDRQQHRRAGGAHDRSRRGQGLDVVELSATLRDPAEAGPARSTSPTRSTSGPTSPRRSWRRACGLLESGEVDAVLVAAGRRRG